MHPMKIWMVRWDPPGADYTYVADEHGKIDAVLHSRAEAVRWFRLHGYKRAAARKFVNLLGHDRGPAMRGPPCGGCDDPECPARLRPNTLEVLAQTP